MSAGTAETQSGSGLQPASAVANGDGPQITGDYLMTDISKSEPVPATNQAGEVECREALAALVTAAAEYQEAAQQHISDTRYDEDGNLAARDAELSVVALPRARAALATQPATSQEGEDEGPIADAARRIASWSGNKVGVYQAAKRELAATPTPPTLSEDLRASDTAEEVERPLNSNDLYRFMDTLKLSEKREVASAIGFDAAYLPGENDMDRWKRMWLWAAESNKKPALATAIRAALARAQVKA